MQNTWYMLIDYIIDESFSRQQAILGSQNSYTWGSQHSFQLCRGLVPQNLHWSSINWPTNSPKINYLIACLLFPFSFKKKEMKGFLSWKKINKILKKWNSSIMLITIKSKFISKQALSVLLILTFKKKSISYHI